MKQIALKKAFTTAFENARVSKVSHSETFQEMCNWFPLEPITDYKRYILAAKIMEQVMVLAIRHESDSKLKKVVEGISKYISALGALIGEYERKAYPEFNNAKTTGAEMLAFLIEQHRLTQKDLAKELGGQSVVSSILKGKRTLNVNQIEALSNRFSVSPEVFFNKKKRA